MWSLWLSPQTKRMQSIRYTCHRKNPFAHMCFTKSLHSDHQKLHEVGQQSDTNTNEVLFLGELESSQKDKNELFTNLNVNDKKKTVSK